jgi:hypothetical protein|tara:strand:- start:804 stop:965 length:162 start_codon:yes stop_codon:yes gene_type:complete
MRAPEGDPDAQGDPNPCREEKKKGEERSLFSYSSVSLKHDFNAEAKRTKDFRK